MPEAAINEDGDAVPREDDVWPHTDSIRQVQPEILAEAKARSVEG